jgi:golgi-specific brefeldin A-resistance guanine nucleotide exchange factor 1
VVTVMRRGLRHPHADDATAVEHPLIASRNPLIASLWALCHLAFFPIATAVSSPFALLTAALRPFLDAIRSEEVGAVVTSASLAVIPELLEGHWGGGLLGDGVDANGGERPGAAGPG